MSLDTKQIHQIKISKDKLESDINSSWKEFLKNDNSNFKNSNNIFTKHIFNLYIKFKSKNNFLIAPDILCFPTEKKFCFVCSSNKEIEHIGYLIDGKIDRVAYGITKNMTFTNMYFLELLKEYFNITQVERVYRKNSNHPYRGIYVTINEEFYKVFASFFQLNLNIDDFKDSTEYKMLKSFKFENKKFVLSKNPELYYDSRYVRQFLYEDKIRADIKEYDEKILTDINRGLWDLWDIDDKSDKNTLFIELKNPLIARNPESSIKNGIVGIDFGTKSTVVVYQGESAKIHPMRVGIGDLGKKVEKLHYENPTIINFNDLSQFIKDYRSKEGKPPTKWSDVNISHTAYSSLLASASSEYNSYLSDLKQWAGKRNKQIKIFDKKGVQFEIPNSVDIKENDINPIEIYAYYLGLYINNQHNGIFLNYSLSFPVTYELDVRDMILSSFKKGIIKSLPNSLQRAEILDRLNVRAGASEPAAYAIMALEEYGFDPVNDQRVYYGVFDFGGGTTDFDFGIYKEADANTRYDYILEHFGAGGDRYLGGENLLELASFEVFKKNINLMLENKIPFTLYQEAQKFPGSEILISDSQEARINTKTLMEKLRPLWEAKDNEFAEDGSISLNLFSSNGEDIPGISLTIDKKEILQLIKDRIKKGVDNFFEEFRLATAKNLDPQDSRQINEFHIFLAGNSSKSAFVDELFKERIKQETEAMMEKNFKFELKLYRPIGENSNDLEKPNGKTGVAFGLIRSRKGGNIHVIDRNISQDINFKYYIGRMKKRKFLTVIDRKQNYGEWIKFIDACESEFEVYYTTQGAVSTNNVSIDDSGISKKILNSGLADKDSFIYLRLASPNEFEFVVSNDDSIKDEIYKTEITKVVL